VKATKIVGIFYLFLFAWWKKIADCIDVFMDADAWLICVSFFFSIYSCVILEMFQSFLSTENNLNSYEIGDLSGLGSPSGVSSPLGDGDGGKYSPYVVSGTGSGGVLFSRGAERSAKTRRG
jgi:hypothetical protein